MNYNLIENKVDSIKKYFKMSWNIYFLHKNLPVKFLHQLQFQRVPWGATVAMWKQQKKYESAKMSQTHEI